MLHDGWSKERFGGIFDTMHAFMKYILEGNLLIKIALFTEIL